MSAGSTRMKVISSQQVLQLLGDHHACLREITEMFCPELEMLSREAICHASVRRKIALRVAETEYTSNIIDLHLSKALFSQDPDNRQLHCFVGLGALFFCSLDQSCKTLQKVQIAPSNILFPNITACDRYSATCPNVNEGNELQVADKKMLHVTVLSKQN